MKSACVGVRFCFHRWTTLDSLGGMAEASTSGAGPPSFSILTLCEGVLGTEYGVRST